MCSKSQPALLLGNSGEPHSFMASSLKKPSSRKLPLDCHSWRKSNEVGSGGYHRNPRNDQVLDHDEEALNFSRQTPAWAACTFTHVQVQDLKAKVWIIYSADHQSCLCFQNSSWNRAENARTTITTASAKMGLKGTLWVETGSFSQGFSVPC